MRDVSLLIKPASSSCNMRCQYCFYADITDIREVKNYGMMSLETLETLVKQALSEATRSCTFGFQGGEPTLAGLNFFKALILLEKKHNINSVEIHHAIQTNGMMIDDEWAAFLGEHKFLTGLSIDASKKVHDELRLNAQGKGTHNQCLKVAQLLTKHGVEYNVLSVITRQLASHPEKAYQFYKQQGFRFLQFIPCLDGLEEEYGSQKYSLSAKAYGQFLCRIFDLWYTDFKKGNYISIRAFDNYIHMLAGHPPENCAMMGECKAYPLIEADGSVFPCDFYALDEYKLGNIKNNSLENMLSSAKAREFEAPSTQINTACQACDYYSLCRGGCRRDRESGKNTQLGLNHYCDAYKMFFAHSMQRMKALAKELF